jgi:hypothetical protein
MVFREEDHFTSRLIATAVVLSSLCLPLSTALAQSDACISSPDPYNPSEKILRCGAALTVRPAPGTVYRPLEAKQGGPPAAVQLDSGALLIEFHPTRGRRHFQTNAPGDRIRAGHPLGHGGQTRPDLDLRAQRRGPGLPCE